MSVGCILGKSLGISLRSVGQRLVFGSGEEILTAWLRKNARIAWVEHAVPWELERAVISSLDLPLNLLHNMAHPFYLRLKGLRKAYRRSALSASG